MVFFFYFFSLPLYIMSFFFFFFSFNNNGTRDYLNVYRFFAFLRQVFSFPLVALYLFPLPLARRHTRKHSRSFSHFSVCHSLPISHRQFRVLTLFRALIFSYPENSLRAAHCTQPAIVRFAFPLYQFLLDPFFFFLSISLSFLSLFPASFFDF